MLKCDDFIGCFGSCEKSISTGIVADFTGEFIVEYQFAGVHKTFKGQTIQTEEIKIKNEFTPGVIHCVRLKKNRQYKNKNNLI